MYVVVVRSGGATFLKHFKTEKSRTCNFCVAKNGGHFAHVCWKYAMFLDSPSLFDISKIDI